MTLDVSCQIIFLEEIKDILKEIARILTDLCTKVVIQNSMFIKFDLRNI